MPSFVTQTHAHMLPWFVLATCMVMTTVVTLHIAMASFNVVPWWTVPGRAAAQAGALRTSSLSASEVPTATIVLMSWERVENVKNIIRTYAQYPTISRVLLWNGKPDTREELVPLLEEVGPHFLRMFQVEGKDPGLYARFAVAALAEEQTVIIQDDDCIMSEHGMQEILTAQREEPGVLHGIIGRGTTEASPYAPDNLSTDHAPIVLTRFLVASRWHMAHFWKLCAHMEDWNAEYGIKPRGQGEDIMLNLASIKAQGGKLHRLHPYLARELRELPQGTESINRRVTNHMQVRRALVRECFEKLDMNLPKSMSLFAAGESIDVGKPSAASAAEWDAPPAYNGILS